jgi:glycogen debranching enzyme
LNALALAATWETSAAARWSALFAQGRASFEARFWDGAHGRLFDVVDVDHHPGTVDDTFRPNQIFAAGGLPISLISDERARQVVDAVEAALVTPLGLRSLAPGQPGYVAHYQGGVAARDGAYHQGTVWPWLMGPFVEAYVRVRGTTAEAKATARARFLAPLLAHLEDAGVGHLSEVADAEPPFTPGGCPFQAWSMGELVRLERVVLAADPAATKRPARDERRTSNGKAAGSRPS